MPVTVFLVDGREIVRQGIKMLLHDSEASLVGEANDGAEALKKLKNLKADLVLVDMNMSSEMPCLEFVQRLKKEYPDIKVLIFSMNEHESRLIDLLEAGADGYILKSTAKDELVFAIQKMVTIGSYMRPGFIVDLLAKYKTESETVTIPGVTLTEREQDVLKLIAEGFTNVQMAKKLFTSVRTIETRRKKILEKTGMTNTATLIRFSVLNGLIK